MIPNDGELGAAGNIAEYSENRLLEDDRKRIYFAHANKKIIKRGSDK